MRLLKVNAYKEADKRGTEVRRSMHLDILGIFIANGTRSTITRQWQPTYFTHWLTSKRCAIWRAQKPNFAHLLKSSTTLLSLSAVMLGIIVAIIIMMFALWHQYTHPHCVAASKTNNMQCLLKKNEWNHRQVFVEESSDIKAMATVALTTHKNILPQKKHVGKRNDGVNA